MSAFAGIPPQALTFLAELAANNSTEWFTPRKADYEALIQTPVRRLLAALAPAMLAIDPGFDTNPMGAAVSRIRRDTRFSRDKSPYRARAWISFKRPGDGWQDRPAFFVGFGPSGYACGMGYFAARPATMTALRAAALAHPLDFSAAMAEAETAGFTLAGERYSRPRLPPSPPDSLSPLAREWFAHKSAHLRRERPQEPLFFSAGLVDDLAGRFRTLTPLYRLLSDLSSG